MKRVKLAATGLLLLGCTSEAAPNPQWIVTLRTDAPLPHFGDRLRIDVTLPGGELACAGCSQLFDASATDFPMSFGVTPTHGNTALVVRARLFRGAAVGADGSPAGSAYIDAAGRLPATPGRAELALAMACFGVTGGFPATTCDPGIRQLAPIAELPRAVTGDFTPGSWAPAASVPCGAVPTDMVCVPGGAFILGEPDGPPYADANEARPEHLVVLAPFALDADEVTVGRVRAIAPQLSTTPTPATPGDDPKSGCTYSPAGENDALPVNCLGRDLAVEICAALGKRLPSEAEWEYAASGAGAESTFPWGEDDAVCDFAVISRGYTSWAQSDESCIAINPAISPGLVPAGQPLDQGPLGIKNLAGNVAEWVSDDFVPYDTGCWTEPPPLANPVCAAAGAKASVRGGSWKSARQYARAAARWAAAADASDVAVGLRCAIDAPAN